MRFWHFAINTGTCQTASLRNYLKFMATFHKEVLTVRLAWVIIEGFARKSGDF